MPSPRSLMLAATAALATTVSAQPTPIIDDASQTTTATVPPSSASADAPATSAESTIPIHAMFGTPGGGIRVAAGIGAGAIDASIVPAGDVFTGFDVRANAGDNAPSGYQSAMPWTADSVKAAISSASDGYKPQIQTHTIESDQELSSALSFKASLNGAFLGGAGSVSASFGYDTSRSSSSHIVSGYTYASAVLPGRVLALGDALWLTPEALGYLQTDVGRFLDVYGTHYIKARRYGCEATAAYVYSCQTQSAKDAISASLKGSYKGATFDVSAEVNATYSTLAKSGICKFEGSMSSTGMDIMSPSQRQLLNYTTMDTYFNKFSENCYAAASTDRPRLLYVEIAGWLDVAAVRAAVANNQTAADVLDFYGRMQQQDLYALSLGAMLQARVTQAAHYNWDDSFANPMITTGFFDRVSGQAMAPVDPSYWKNLPTAHASVVAQLQQSRLDQFLAKDAVMQAIASKTPITQIASNYFKASRQLYALATDTYKYAYSSIRLVFKTFDWNNVDIISSALEVPTNRLVAGKDNRMAYQWTHAGDVPLTFTLFADASKAVPGALRLLAAVQIVDINKFYWSDPEQIQQPSTTSNAIDITDVDGGIHVRCSTCPEARMDISISYIMPDISFSLSLETFGAGGV